MKLNGRSFTTTFIFGSWDGDVIFAEPMITKAFLESKPQFDAELPAAQRYAGSGYYSTDYSVRSDEGAREWRIALTRLVKR